MPAPSKRIKFEDNAKDVLDYISSLGREYTIMSFVFTGTSLSIRYLEVGTSQEINIISLDDRTAVAEFIAELASYDGTK